MAALALLAAAPPPQAPVPAAADDPDLRCVAAVSMVMGVMPEGETNDPELRTGLASIFMYYMGKLDARRPGIDYLAELTGLFERPGYSRQLAADLKRCGAEAEERGRMLQELGKDLKSSVPLTQARPG